MFYGSISVHDWSIWYLLVVEVGQNSLLAILLGDLAHSAPISIDVALVCQIILYQQVRYVKFLSKDGCHVRCQIFYCIFNVGLLSRDLLCN